MGRNTYSRLDLNLLNTLRIIDQERNLGRVAQHLHVTQPAVSQALGKLRHQLRDELFIRTRRGLEPTAFATDLLARTTPLLDQLTAALSERQAFDPAGIEGPIRVALSPHVASYLSARLFDAVHARAPKSSLHLSGWNDHSLGELVSGRLHLGINLRVDGIPGELELDELAEDRFTGYVREDHPLVQRSDQPLLRDLDGCELATLIIPGWNTQGSHFERIMQANGYSAHVRFRSDSPAAIMDVVRNSDLVYPASSHILERDLRGLTTFAVRVHEHYLNHPLLAYYNRRDASNPLTSWLRGVLKDLMAAPG